MVSYILSAWLMFGAIAPFTERGVTDFDTVLSILNPHGVWVENSVTHSYSYRPFCAEGWIPFVDGQWVYSDYGWFWRGNEPHQSVTSHYGYWKRESSGVWGWIPRSEWHTNPVDWRGTKTHIGWRSSPLSKIGDFTESEEKRVLDPNEWIFVKREDFGKPLNRAYVITGEEAKTVLLDSYSLSHEIELYRVIARAGPDPKSYEGAQPRRELNQPPPPDLEKVRYYMTMSLPSYETAIPIDAKPDQIYIYRPKFFQDNDGIQRRIKIWNNPKDRIEAVEKVNQALGVTAEISEKKAEPAVPTPEPSEKISTPPVPQEVKKEGNNPKKPTFRSRS